MRKQQRPVVAMSCIEKLSFSINNNNKMMMMMMMIMMVMKMQTKKKEKRARERCQESHDQFCPLMWP
jgi:hypothetical protein